MLKSKKWDPVSEKDMLVEKPWLTICEVLRQIYNTSDNEEHKYLLRVACNMAKRMQNKLKDRGNPMVVEDWDRIEDVK